MSTQYDKCENVLDEYRLTSSAVGIHFYSNILIIILNAVLLVPGMISNFLLVAIYLKNTRLRNSCTVLFFCLALSDLMVTMIVQPICIVKKIQEILGSDVCATGIVSKLTTYACCGCSMVTVVFLSVERFVTLAYPYHYQNIVNRFRLKVSVVSSWSFIIMVSISHYFYQSIIHFYLSAAGIMCSIVIVAVVWIWIHRLVLHHKRQILEQEKVQMATARRQKVISATITSYVIITVILISYFPSFVTNAFTLPNGSSFSVYYLVYPWILIVLYGKSTVTPFLVFQRKKIVRDHAKAFCNALLCRVKRVY